jgi:tetratricopeptide (TPR) repeat protein
VNIAWQMFRFFRQIAFRKPRPPADHREAALAALAQGSYAQAELLFSGLLAEAETPGERAFLLNKRGVARIGLGLRAQARDDFEAAVGWHGRHAPALTNLGNLLLEEGRVEEAIAAYETAIAADGDYATAYLNLGTAYKRAGRLHDAVRARRTARRLEVRNPARPTERP